ncbi:MAG: tryptophan--tRNA ligase [Holosporaceae bacterium]|jgi:tryptophanyl-tRNA synthetase|nr:tryptophan--tRNA ligase [Holosporaceae bacterium]
MTKKIILTGDRPTGKLHLGHFVGSLKSRVELQSSHDQYVMVADVQALTDYFENPQKVVDNVWEIVADYISVGIDPQLTTIFIQSQIPALGELTTYYMNLVSISRLERNPTVKAEIAQKGFGESVPTGFFCYPISQAADITAFKAELVPVGEDQLPMIELSNEIVRKFNRLYNTDCLKEAKPHLSNVGRLVGIDGKAKAGKSLNNAIFLNDSPEIIKQKVYSMFTDPDHLKATDPGKIEGNVVFAYLDAFHEDKEEVSSLKKQYVKGGLGDTVLKSLLNETLQKILFPIREKRESLVKQDLIECCFLSTQKAKSVAQKTLDEVKHAMGVDFFGKKPSNSSFM